MTAHPLYSADHFKEILAQKLSIRNIQNIVDLVGNNQDRFDTLLELALTADKKTAFRAAWALEKISLKHEFLFLQHIDRFVNELQTIKTDGVRRSILKVLQSLAFDEKYAGKLYHLCSEYIISTSQPIAVKAYAMEIMKQIACSEPDLVPEFQMILEFIEPHASAGIKTRIHHIRKDLSKLQSAPKHKNCK